LAHAGCAAFAAATASFVSSTVASETYRINNFDRKKKDLAQLSPSATISPVQGDLMGNVLPSEDALY